MGRRVRFGRNSIYFWLHLSTYIKQFLPNLTLTGFWGGSAGPCWGLVRFFLFHRLSFFLSHSRLWLSRSFLSRLPTLCLCPRLLVLGHIIEFIRVRNQSTGYCSRFGQRELQLRQARQQVIRVMGRTEQRAALNKENARRRWKIEVVFSRLKNFRILTCSRASPSPPCLPCTAETFSP